MFHIGIKVTFCSDKLHSDKNISLALIIKFNLFRTYLKPGNNFEAKDSEYKIIKKT